MTCALNCRHHSRHISTSETTSYKLQTWCRCAITRPPCSESTPGLGGCAHLDQRVGLGQVVAAGRLVVEVARMRLREAMAAAEHVAAAALEPRQPNLQHAHAWMSLTIFRHVIMQGDVRSPPNVPRAGTHLRQAVTSREQCPAAARTICYSMTACAGTVDTCIREVPSTRGMTRRSAVPSSCT